MSKQANQRPSPADRPASVTAARPLAGVKPEMLFHDVLRRWPAAAGILARHLRRQAKITIAPDMRLAELAVHCGLCPDELTVEIEKAVEQVADGQCMWCER